MPEGGGSKSTVREIKILHAADLHMDSPFEALGAGKAAVRRSEQRELLGRLTETVKARQIDLVLLPGDLLDSDKTYCETGEELCRALEQMSVPVFIAPGNHDFYSARSPYARLKMPGNVHIFASPRIECVPLPELSARVYGAGFTDKRSGAMLEGFRAERTEGIYNILCIHGEVGARESAYNPVTEAQLASSGMDYAALGHIHKTEGLKRAGDCFYSWPGCPEGRGFDETGEKTVNIVTLREDDCTLETVSVAGRKYESIFIDVSEGDPRLAIHAKLPDDTASDIYRITLTGETDETPDLRLLHRSFDELFFELQLRDETHLRTSLWEKAGEDTLRGLFLKKLKDRLDMTADPGERRVIEQAARWGMAALDGREEIAKHEDQ